MLRCATFALGLTLLVGCPGSAASNGQHDGESDTGDPGLDPLSMPHEPTLSPTHFNSSKKCQGCHPNHYAQWQLSRHSRAMRDPVYRALVAIRQADFDGAEDQFCTQCHSAICTRGGECTPGFSFDALSTISLEGVTCEACHKVSKIMRPFNAGHELDPTGPLRGPIVDPVANGFHASKHDAMFDDAKFCGGCHDVLEISGLALERPYAEWLESPANPEQPCQSCHMPTYTGTAALGGPERDNLHRHHFVGVDLPMEGDVDDATFAEIDAEIDALLASAAKLELELPHTVVAGQQLDIELTVENLIAGHDFPTGSTFLRQVWVELTVTDANAQLLYATGQLDSEGDLRDAWSTVAPNGDPDLIEFDSEFRAAHGNRELFPWRATQHSSTALAPMAKRTYGLMVTVPEDAAGPLSVDATLHFRSYPPFLLRMLGLDELLGLAVIRDIASASGGVAVAG